MNTSLFYSAITHYKTVKCQNLSSLIITYIFDGYFTVLWTILADAVLLDIEKWTTPITQCFRARITVQQFTAIVSLAPVDISAPPSCWPNSVQRYSCINTHCANLQVITMSLDYLIAILRQLWYR